MFPGNTVSATVGGQFSLFTHSQKLTRKRTPDNMQRARHTAVQHLLACFCVYVAVFLPSQVQAAETCSFVVSPGDTGVGIAVFTDPGCPTVGGVGCFGDASVCRYCKNRNTPQAQNFIDCATTAPTPAPAPVPAPVQAPASSASAAVNTPAADSCSNMLATNALTATGIWATFDPSCPRDGTLGDCNEFCRMCKFAETSASANLRTCSSVLTTVAAAGTPAPQVVQTATPPANACTTVGLAQDSVNSGIWLKLTCLRASGGGACLEAQCDYCKYFETKASANYPPCDDPISSISDV